ncbi:hypothetical protein GVAV_000145 [Gurleya vavrai]
MFFFILLIVSQDSQSLVTTTEENDLPKRPILIYDEDIENNCFSCFNGKCFGLSSIGRGYQRLSNNTRVKKDKNQYLKQTILESFFKKNFINRKATYEECPNQEIKSKKRNSELPTSTKNLDGYDKMDIFESKRTREEKKIPKNKNYTENIKIFYTVSSKSIINSESKNSNTPTRNLDQEQNIRKLITELLYKIFLPEPQTYPKVNDKIHEEPRDIANEDTTLKEIGCTLSNCLSLSEIDNHKKNSVFSF